MSSDRERAGLWSELTRAEHSLSRGGDGFPTGPRQFDSLGQATASGNVWGALRHQVSRVQRVREALNLSGPLAQQRMVQTLAGIDLSSIWNILVEAVKDIALYYGGSVVAGATIGGVLGAFAGGVGAVPGASGGAAVGATVGTWVLAFLGLKSLVEGLLDTIPEALRCYEQGFREAWGATHWERQSVDAFVPAQRANTEIAAATFANGHVLMIMALLTALLAYLTRGRGDRAAVLSEIRQSSRLGPKVAQWLEQNETRLRDNPRLKPRETKGATAPVEEPRARGEKHAEKTHSSRNVGFYHDKTKTLMADEANTGFGKPPYKHNTEVVEAVLTQ